MMMDIHKILRTLPHRFPFILVDRVLEIEDGKRIVAIKNVTINEPFFPGHFPDFPVMPGVLIIEAMAQAGAILTFTMPDMQAGPDSLFYFAGIDRARFKRRVQPGDQLRLEVEFMRSMRGIAKFQGRALVEGQLAAEAEMMCAFQKTGRAASIS
jgi:3-hydroxyacyl-[acyl-carrier-protein] dehydratase